jgi:proline-specific peptidase
VLTYQEHVRSLILYSGAASTAECVTGMNALRASLSPHEQEVLARHEAAGTIDHADYKAVLETLYERHLCRIRPVPPELLASMLNMGRPVYETMWGPNEFVCTGNLLGWDVTDRLGEIRVPTLITHGRHDEVVPSCGETLHRGIPNARLEIFEASSHHAHVEERDRYFAILQEFLAGVSQP